jgi:hypothetical protein
MVVGGIVSGVVIAMSLSAGVLPVGGQAYVYPSKGQSPQQQQKDQADCQAWAIQQPGANPAAVPPPPGPQGQVVRGAARGAAVGAVGGAIGGDAGKGAAAGAAAGALVGGMRRRDDRREAQAAQGQANDAFNRAFAACLVGPG